MRSKHLNKKKTQRSITMMNVKILMLIKFRKINQIFFEILNVFRHQINFFWIFLLTLICRFENWFVCVDRDRIRQWFKFDFFEKIRKWIFIQLSTRVFFKKKIVRCVFVFFDRFSVFFRRETVIREIRDDRASRESRRDICFLIDFVRNFDMFDEINDKNEREFNFFSMRFKRFRHSLSTLFEFFDSDDDFFDFDFVFDVKMKKKNQKQN